ncbi:hypothetical protein INR49_009845, partial [Caranx melampygus]
MSSLLDHGLIRTTAVEQVVAPIASHLCHLVLLCDSIEEPEQFGHLEEAAQAVAKATENMAAVASRRIKKTDDEVLHMEMSSLLESVAVSGQHVLLAAQKLSIQPSLAEHREELITATQNVFLRLVKVLLVDDDATVRRVVAAAHWVLECLSELGSSMDITSLLRSFQGFSEALSLLNSLTVERAHSLQDPTQTKQLFDSLETLRKCITMLHTAMCTTIKHPANEQAQASKRYILDKVHSTVSDIIITLEAVADNAKSLENVENSRACLARLRAQIAPISLELEDNTMQIVQKLHEVCQKWEEETSQLLDALSDVMDVKEFTSIAISEMVSDRHGCDAAYREQSYEQFDEHATKLICHMKLVIHSVRRHLDSSDNPIYRNGLLVLLKQVQSSQAKVHESVKSMLSVEDTCDLNLDHMVRGYDSPVLELMKRDSHAEHEEEHSDEETIETQLGHKYDSDDLRIPAVSDAPELIRKPLNFDLLPLLYKVVTVTKEKDVTVLNQACTGVLELSNCYAQAAKEALAIVDAVDCQTLESFRAELVSLTPLLVQTAQEMAMSSAMSTENIYKHSSQFSDLINNIRKVLIPVAGTWYHAVYTALQAYSDSQETFSVLHNKLNKAQNNTRYLVEFSTSLEGQISDVISRARLMVETHYICDMFSLEVQIQCWSAKAHYVVDEIKRQDGIHQEAKEQIRVGLQGKTIEDIEELLPANLPKVKEVEFPSGTAVTSWQKRKTESVEANMNRAAVTKYSTVNLEKGDDTGFGAFKASSLTYTSIFLKQESDSWDSKDNRIVQMTRKMADTICYMTQYLKSKGPILNKEAFVTAAKDVMSNCQSVTQFIRVIANHCLDKQCTVELSLIVEQILTITNQLNIISSVNAVTPGCKSSDEILVKNAQNLLQTVLRGVHAAETACITGLKQPEPNSDGEEATALCFQWKRNLEIHRAQQTSNLETDDLGLRKTSSHPVAPSLAPPVNVQGGYKALACQFGLSGVSILGPNQAGQRLDWEVMNCRRFD